MMDRSLVSGVIRTLNLAITEAQIEAWERGAINLNSFNALIQPDVDADETDEFDEPNEYFSD